MSTRLKNYAKKRLNNKHFMSVMKTERKRCLSLIKGKKVDQVKEAIGKFDSIAQKLGSKGIIHKNKARRLVSRLAKKQGV